MKLIVHDTYTNVEGHVKDIHILKKILSVRPPGYQFSKKFRRGWWDGYVSLYDKKKDAFPTGLLNFVLSSISKYDIDDYEVIIKNLYDTIAYDPIVQLNDLTLRNYQVEAVNSVLENTRGILHMATNAGKTAICASIVKSINGNAVVIVPNRSLLLQTSKDLGNLLGIEIGMFGSGYKNFRNVNVTTMQSMHHLLKNDLSDNEIVVIDECHHTQADTLYKYIYDIPGPFRIGMSGTPLKYDVLSDMKLIGATGNIIYHISNDDLIRAGYSSDVLIQFYELDNSDEEDYEELYVLPYIDAYRDCIVENDIRNELIASICNDCNGPVLIMVNWIDHANAISQHLDLEDSLVITGDNTNEEIEDAMKNLGVTYKVLVATSVFKEGINIPSIEHLIIASGGKGHIQLLQRIGRGLRKSKGKDKLYIYDFIDDTNNYLVRHSLERLKIYESEGFKVELVEN